jgi:acylphosphatase
MNDARHVVVSGRVQGVGFRFFVQEWADSLGVVGYVRNLPDGRVEAWLEGPPHAVAEVVQRIRRGPPAARVDAVVANSAALTGRYADFRITW